VADFHFQSPLLGIISVPVEPFRVPIEKRRDPTLQLEGELRTGPEAIDVPISVYVGTTGAGTRLEFEAEQVAAQNRSIRIENLTPAEVRQLRDAFDEALSPDDHE